MWYLSPRGSTFQAMVSVMAVKIQFSSPRGVLRSFSRPGILDKMSFALVLPWLLKQAKESDTGTDLDREESLRLKERWAGCGWEGLLGPGIPIAPTCLLQEDKRHRLTLSSSTFTSPLKTHQQFSRCPCVCGQRTAANTHAAQANGAQDMCLVLPGDPCSPVFLHSPV